MEVDVVKFRSAEVEMLLINRIEYRRPMEDQLI